MSISICVCLLEYTLHEFTILSIGFLNSSTIGKLNSIVNFAPNREKALKKVNFIVSTSQLQKRCLYNFLKKPVKERQKRTERNCWENIEIRGHPLLFIVISVSDYVYTIFQTSSNTIKHKSQNSVTFAIHNCSQFSRTLCDLKFLVPKGIIKWRMRTAKNSNYKKLPGQKIRNYPDS